MINETKIQQIKEALETSHLEFLAKFIGVESLTQNQKKRLTELRIKATSAKSSLSLMFNVNAKYGMAEPAAPQTIAEAMALKLKDANPAIAAHLNAMFNVHFAKIGVDEGVRVEALIRTYNEQHRLADQHGIGEAPTVEQLKQEIKAATVKTVADVQRTVTTEIANALGSGSMEHLVSTNKGKDLSQIYVYRLSVLDSKLCKFCRKDYNDGGGESPAVYRLSTILGNGSNYGRKQANWLPVATAHHPNDRESGLLELKPGWSVSRDGKVNYIGLAKWDAYIAGKVRA